MTFLPSFFLFFSLSFSRNVARAFVPVTVLGDLASSYVFLLTMRYFKYFIPILDMRILKLNLLLAFSGDICCCKFPGLYSNVVDIGISILDTQ